MTAREILINTAIANYGDWNAIYGAVREKDYDAPSCDNVGQCLTILDENYPARLKQTYKPPFVLFYKGDISLLDKDNIVSIVGTREPSSQGIYGVDKIVKGIDVAINGGADGLDYNVIDAVEHQIVVLPCGINMEKELVDKVLKKGGLVLTEYPSDVEKTKDTCAARLRIVEAIAHKTLIVEAKKHSNSDMRVSMALQLGHDVFVMPMSLDTNDTFANNDYLADGAIICTKREQLYA